MWCVAKLDEVYIERMEDVLKVYEKPLVASAPVVCLDEKPVVLHADTRPPGPMRPGHVARRDYEYKRCGTANVFCAVEPKAGRHFTKPTATRKAPDFAEFLLEIAASYPKADTIHLVLDNLSTHTRKAVVDFYGEKDGDWLWGRFTVHYTPKHGSWLNQAEIEIGIFGRQCLGKRRIGNIADLITETRAWNQRINQNQTTIDWTFTRKKARLTLKYNIMRSRY
jgi:DDE superfamily endonuclease